MARNNRPKYSYNNRSRLNSRDSKLFYSANHRNRHTATIPRHREVQQSNTPRLSTTIHDVLSKLSLVSLCATLYRGFSDRLSQPPGVDCTAFCRKIYSVADFALGSSRRVPFNVST